MPQRVTRRLYRPKNDDPCLCGSGIGFGGCCADHLPGFDRGKKLSDVWRKGDWNAALVIARADFSQYAIWHKTNTEPVMAVPDPAIQHLLSIDIEALDGMAADISTIYFRLGRQNELPSVFERLRSRINDIRWQRKITYHQALFADARGDAAGALAEFAKLEPITADEKDVGILQLYIQLHGDGLAFARRLAICDQIISLSEKSSDHLQYGGVKAIAYLSIGDFKQAGEEFSKSIAYARKRAEEAPLSTRAKNLFAATLSTLALFTRDKDLFAEAEEKFKELLADIGAWTPLGRASVMQELGECYRYSGDWKKGEDIYRQAIAVRSSGIARVFLAECVLHQGKNAEAAKILDDVVFADLSESEQIDLAYTAAAVAVEIRDRQRMDAAIDLLKRVKSTAPYFEERRLKLIIQLQEIIADGGSPSVLAKIRALLVDPIARLNRYVLLQPNWNGVGVNLNALIDDLIGPKGGDDKKPKE